MNIKKLKSIINSELPEYVIESQVINLLAKDKNVIPDILKILESERNLKNDLITDMNLELSRAHIYIELSTETKKQAKDSFNKSFVINEIKNFYTKYKSNIKHCFNRFN